MSLNSREARFTAAAAAVALSALAAASPASALNVGDPGTASGSLAYTCTVPIIGDQPVTADVKTNIPLTWPVSTLTPAFQIAVDARAKGDTYLGLQIVGAAPGGTLVGKGKAPNQTNGGVTSARLVFPTASGAISTLNLTIPITIPTTTVPDVDPGAPAGLAIRPRASPEGLLPSPRDGADLRRRHRPQPPRQGRDRRSDRGLGTATDSDGDPQTFDLPCSGPSVKLADITVGVGTPTPTPGTPTPTPLPPTPTPIGTPTPPPFGDPDADPDAHPAAADPDPDAGRDPRADAAPGTPTPTPIGTPTPPPSTPTPLPPLTQVDYGYAVAGNAVLKGLTSGTIAISGTGQYKLTLQTGAAIGKTTISPASAKLQAVRLLPITARSRSPRSAARRVS